MTKTKKAPRAAETGAKFATREEWLVEGAHAMRSLFDAQGADAYPRFRVSCGWPKGGRKAIGQAWTPDASGDATAELFISPEIEDPVRVLDILMHELVHAVVGNEVGHKGPFRKLAKSLGLEGKMMATVASEALATTLGLLLGALGPYPHAQLSKLTITKQSTRMLKLTCTCGFICRTTQKWLDDVGCPTCACGNKMEGPTDG